MELKMVFPLRSVPGPGSKPLCSDGTEAISNRLENQQAGSTAARHPGRNNGDRFNPETGTPVEQINTVSSRRLLQGPDCNGQHRSKQNGGGGWRWGERAAVGRSREIGQPCQGRAAVNEGRPAA
ncbi:hypothetical protein SRHO_G00087590 [Serrasalmus rhombeus]